MFSIPRIHQTSASVCELYGHCPILVQKWTFNVKNNSWPQKVLSQGQKLQLSLWGSKEKVFTAFFPNNLNPCTPSTFNIIFGCPEPQSKTKTVFWSKMIWKCHHSLYLKRYLCHILLYSRGSKVFQPNHEQIISHFWECMNIYEVKWFGILFILLYTFLSVITHNLVLDCRPRITKLISMHGLSCMNKSDSIMIFNRCMLDWRKHSIFTPIM